MGHMLGWRMRSAKRFVCRYGCCIWHIPGGDRTRGAERARDKRRWRKEIV